MFYLGTGFYLKKNGVWFLTGVYSIETKRFYAEK